MLEGKQYVLNYPMPDASPKAKKMIGYLKFRQFATKILKKNNYQKVVLTSANAGVLLKEILIAKYSGRYVIDIRDYFMENNKLYYLAEKKVIENSGLAVISSRAYKCFLPVHRYLLAHNLPNIEREVITEAAKEIRKKKKKETITLSYIGGVSFFEQDKKVLRYFANDKRFLIRYIGNGANILKEYCEKERISNVYFHDTFPPEQTLEYFKETDIILNLYGNKTPLLDYALSNKLYYAAMLEIPILVCPQTYMEEVAVKGGFGFALDLNDVEGKEKLIAYYKNIDLELLHQGCQKFMDKVEKEDLYFCCKMKKFLNDY